MEGMKVQWDEKVKSANIDSSFEALKSGGSWSWCMIKGERKVMCTRGGLGREVVKRENIDLCFMFMLKHRFMASSKKFLTIWNMYTL